MKPEPGRCVQAMNRIMEVLSAEFDDLDLPEVGVILQLLLYTHMKISQEGIERELDQTSKCG